MGSILIKKLKHDFLIKLIRAFAPNISEKGICEGVTSIWLQAVLIGEDEEANFYKRFDLLSTYLSSRKKTLKDITEEIKNIYSSQKSLAKSSSERKNLTAEQLEKIDIRAFAESVALQQGANELNMFKEYIFQSNKSKLYSFTASKILERGLDLRLMSDLPKNKRIDQGKMYVEKVGDRIKYSLLDPQGGLIEGFLDIAIDNLTKEFLYKIKEDILEETSKREHTSKIKSDIVGMIGLNETELTKYFDEVKEVLKKENLSHPGKRGGFLLGSDDHRVGLYFDTSSGKWHFFDINDLSGKKEYYYSVESARLASLVFYSFFDEKADNTVFSAQYISTYHSPSLVSSLQAISNKLLPNSIGKVNARGYNTLFAAAYMGDVTSIHILINAKSDINAKNKEGWTALMQAANNGHTEIVEALLTANPKVNVNATVNVERWTALMLAAKKGHVEIIQVLLAADPKAKVNAEDHDGWTALMLAIKNEHIEILDALLCADPKANINAEDHGGWTALMLAVERGNIDIILRLLTASPSANINAANKNGETALMVATQNRYKEVVKILLANEPKPNINAKDNDGWSALMLAAKDGDLEMIKVLLAASPNANINAVNKNGETALMLAVENGDVAMLKVLLAANPKPNLAIKNKVGATALKLANIERHTAIIKLLKKAREQANLSMKPKVFLPTKTKYPPPTKVVKISSNLKNRLNNKTIKKNK